MKKLCLMLLLFAACTKAAVSGKVLSEVTVREARYHATANDVYYAVRDTLTEQAYGVASEDLKAGSIVTAWMPTTSDSHFVEVFGRRDSSVNPSYYQLDIQLSPEGGFTIVKVSSHMKSLVSNLKSSGLAEDRVLKGIVKHLRKTEPNITNLGVSEPE